MGEKKLRLKQQAESWKVLEDRMVQAYSKDGWISPAYVPSVTFDQPSPGITVPPGLVGDERVAWLMENDATFRRGRLAWLKKQESYQRNLEMREINKQKRKQQQEDLRKKQESNRKNNNNEIKASQKHAVKQNNNPSAKNAGEKWPHDNF